MGNLRFYLSKRFQNYARRFYRKFFSSRTSLVGDRCVEYGYVVKNLAHLDRQKYKSVLDIGCYASPLTTIMKELGFLVHGVDLLPAVYEYEGIEYVQGDFLSITFDSSYDVIVLCSTVEHIGLEGRYGSKSIEEGDVKTIKKGISLLSDDGLLILTIPYGIPTVIRPFHRVYDKTSDLLKIIYDNLEVINEEYYQKSEDLWKRCSERDASKVPPSETFYALGLFTFRKKTSLSIIT